MRLAPGSLVSSVSAEEEADRPCGAGAIKLNENIGRETKKGRQTEEPRERRGGWLRAGCKSKGDVVRGALLEKHE